MALMPALKQRFAWWNPEVADFWLSHVRPHWSVYRPYALVQQVQREAVDAVTVVCQPNRHVPACLPGQHVQLAITVNGTRQHRYYSPTVRPDGRWQFTVKQVPEGNVSQWINQALQPGAVLEVGAPMGEFHTVPHNEPLLLLAAGSGITPLFSVLQQRLTAGATAPVELWYWAGKREQLCFLEQLKAWQSEHQQFRLQAVLTQEAAVQAGDLSGRLNVALLQQCIADLAHYHVLACGPTGFVRAAAPLQALAASFASETHQPVQAVNAAGEVTVQLAKQSRSVQVAAGKSLLEGLEEAGVAVPFGCRRGICNTCHCQRLEGTTEHMLLGHEASGAGAVQLCVAQAKTDLSLNL